MQKKYITRQEDIKDCGAASISSIIKYYNGYVPLDTLKEDTFTNKEGTTAYHVVKTLEKYGFQAYGMRCEENFDILNEKIALPAIAHVCLKNNLQHFIVIYEIDKKNKTIIVMDPAVGYKTLSISEFLDIWTKIIIICKPITKIPKYKKVKKLTTKFIKLFLEEKKLVLKIIAVSLMLILISIVSGFFLEITLEQLKTKSNILNYILIFGFVFIFKILLFYFRNYYENILNKNIDEKVILPFLKHVFLIPLSYLKNKTTGEIVTRIKELNNIKNLFSKIFVTIFLELSLSLLTLVIIYKINFLLFILLIIVLALYLVISVIFAPQIKANLELMINNETSFNSTIIENIDGVETIKNNNKMLTIFKKIKNQFIEYLDQSYKFSKLLIKENLFQNIIEEMGIFLVLSLGIFLTFKNELTVLNLFTLNALIVFLINPFKNLASILPEIYYVKSSFNKINEFLGIKEENIKKTNEKFINGDIKIEKLSFSYDNYHYIFKDLNLLIKEKEHILLKGNSGSGKSTLCRLIFRINQYEKGTILIGNKSILDYHLNTVRKNITYLSQDEKLFSGTIRDNIVFYRSINEDYLNKIIKICRVDEILKNKQLGLDTFLVENSYNLSGGEKQRIILARSLLKSSKIIILDEALSEVEIYMEKLIIKDLLFFFKDKTIIYVTHHNETNLFDRVINLTI